MATASGKRLYAALCLCSLALLMSCGPGEGSFRLKGEFKKLSSAQFVIYAQDGSWSKPDTINVADGKFEQDIPLDRPTVMKMLFSNFASMIFVAEPGKTIKVEADASALGVMRIKGTKDNELLTEFRIEQAERKAADRIPAAADFVQKHPTTTAAVGVFYQYFVEGAGAADLAESLASDLATAQPDDKHVQSLARHVRTAVHTAVGRKLGTFEARTTAGRTFSTGELSGKPSVVVFWASWNNASPPVTPLLRAMRRSHADRLNIVSVSLDIDSVQCRKLIERDSIPQPVLADYRGFSSPAVEQWGIRQVPGCLLIDKNGKITARDLKHEEIMPAVEKLLK